jgi:hypothetical protein
MLLTQAPVLDETAPGPFVESASPGPVSVFDMER